MTKERIITATVVTSGEKGDWPELFALLEISQEIGIRVDTILVMQLTQKRRILSWLVSW